MVGDERQCGDADGDADDVNGVRETESSFPTLQSSKVDAPFSEYEDNVVPVEKVLTGEEGGHAHCW